MKKSPITPIFYDIIPKEDTQDQGWASESRPRSAVEESLRRQRDLAEKNQLAVVFVQNILSTNNWLSKHPNPHRLIFARGPAKTYNNKSVGVFLFSDVVIIAKKLMHNRRYISPVIVEVDKAFSAIRTGTRVMFRNLSTSCEVDFETRGESTRWEKSANFCRDWISSSLFGNAWSGTRRYYLSEFT